MLDASDRARRRQLAIEVAGKSTLLYVLGHMLDLITTYWLTPNLTRELNPVIAAYGLGWDYILVSALVTSLVMLAAQLWLWHRIFQRFPDTAVGYGRLYNRILGGTDASHTGRWTTFATGLLIGVVAVTCYALIAAKLFTGAWNLTILAMNPTVDSFVLIMFLKNALAGCIGFAVFCLYPYVLHRRIYAATPGDR